MSEIESALMFLGLGFALSVIFIGRRSGGCMRNPPPPANHIKPAPTPPPPPPIRRVYDDDSLAMAIRAFLKAKIKEK